MGISLTRVPRWLQGTAFALWLVTTGVLTLTPGGGAGPPSLDTFFCLACSPRWGADLVLNVLLFVPCGTLLRGLVGPRRAITAGAGITLVVEAAQLLIPGRHPALTDLLTNTLGAALGTSLPRAMGRTAVRIAIAAVAAGLWLAPSLLLSPRPTQATLWAQWTPRLSGMHPYDGRVLEARVGGRPAKLELADRLGVREALRERSPVAVTFVAGTAPERLAPLFAIYDENRRQNLLLAVHGADLVVRLRTVARVLGLDQPDLRWRGALEGVRAGDTLQLRLTTSEGSRCLELDGRSRCDLTPTPGRGHAFFLNVEGLPAGAGLLLNLAWVAGLGLAFGWATGTRPWPGLAAAAALAVTGAVLAALSPDVGGATGEAALLALAAWGGERLRRTPNDS